MTLEWSDGRWLWNDRTVDDSGTMNYKGFGKRGRSANEVLSRHFLQGLRATTKHSEVKKCTKFPKTDQKCMPFSESTCDRAITATTCNTTQPSPATVKFANIWNSLKQGVTFDRSQTWSTEGWTPSFRVTVLLNSTQSLQFGEVVGNRKSRASHPDEF